MEIGQSTKQLTFGAHTRIHKLLQKTGS